MMKQTVPQDAIVHQLQQRVAELEKQLAEARGRADWFARFPNENPNPVVRVSGEGKVIYHNAAAANTPGWVCALGHPAPAPTLPLLKESMERGQPMEQDLAFDGRTYWISVVPLTTEGYANIYGRDVTARKRAEDALAQSRQRVNDILKSLGDGLLAIDRQWTVIYVNQVAAQIAGHPANELTGRNLWELWPGLVGTPLEDCYRQAMDAGIPGQLRAQGIVRTTRWFDVSVYPSSEGITIYYIDKTGQVEAEESRKKLLEENQEQRELLQKMFEADPGGVAVFTRDDLRFQFANRAYRDLTPFPQEEPVGRALEEVWPSALGFQVMKTYLPPMEDGKPVKYDKITRRFPDRSIRHFSVHLQPLSWQGRPATLVVAWEITQLEEAKAELQDYAEKLKRSNEDLQQFALIASHDLQEPLRKIETFGSLLADKAPQLDERGRDYVARMRDAAERMRRMVESLLELSRVNTRGNPFIAVDLAEVTKEVLSDLSLQIRRTNGTVEAALLPTIEGDPQQLHRLLQNLISNALKFHKPDVPPCVKLSARVLADVAEIDVEDNGIGFEPEYAERIFQPFQRLVGRSEYEGSGMGLAICRRIVERHGGTIHARSRPGQGTTFAVTLPIQQVGGAGATLGKDSIHE